MLRSAWSQFVGKLEERGKREWEEIERERGVVEGFNALEGVFGEGRVRMRKYVLDLYLFCFMEVISGGTEVERSDDQRVHANNFSFRRSKSQQPPPIPPHLLPPSTLYAAHLSTPLTPIAAHLSSQLVAAQSENEQLYEEILAQRREIEELVGMVEGKMADLRSAGGVMGEAIKEGDLRTLLAKVNGEAVGR